MIPVITMLIMLVSVFLTGVPLSRGIILYILMFSFGTFCGISALKLYKKPLAGSFCITVMQFFNSFN